MKFIDQNWQTIGITVGTFLGLGANKWGGLKELQFV